MALSYTAELLPLAAGVKGTVIPSGFSSADDFLRFGTNMREGLSRAGYGNVEPILQGSAEQEEVLNQGRHLMQEELVTLMWHWQAQSCCSVLNL